MKNPEASSGWMHSSPAARAGVTHVFWDAEGTLWTPREGFTFEDFWADPSVDNAMRMFEVVPGLQETLTELESLGCSNVVVSKYEVALLPAIIRAFGLGDHFQDLVINGDKGLRIRDWLLAHGLTPECALMIGDRMDLDILPCQRAGVRALLVDREYNRGPPVGRLFDHRDLPGIVRLLQPLPTVLDGPVGHMEETWTCLAPMRPDGAGRPA